MLLFWLDLPFGVLAALELYRGKQHKLLAGLKEIAPIADDFLIEGCGDTEEEAIHDHVGLMQRGEAEAEPEKPAVLGEGGPLPWPHLISRGSQSAVLQMANPTNARRVQWFIGFVNLSRLMPCLSEV